jgi:uncharacterized repeat protein (TIGR01451 family)
MGIRARKARLEFVTVAAAAAAALVAASAAGGAVTIGQTAGATDNCGSPQSMVQTGTVGGASYVAPSDGVITSWKYQAGNTAQMQQPSVKLKVYMPVTPPTVWFLRAESEAKPATQNTLHNFTASPGIPVKTGDHLGLTGLGGLQMGCISTAQMGDTRNSNGLGGPDTTVGQNNTMANDATFARTDVEATIEPDADGDLFGDETQDQCPSDSTIQGPCQVNLSIAKTAAPEPAGVDQDLTYTITVTNTSSSGPAANVVMNDTLPAGVTFKSSATTQGSCAGTTTVGCNLGSLAQSATVTITIVVTPTAAGAISNTATVSSSTPDPNPADNSATASSTINASPATQTGGPGAGGAADKTAPAIELAGKASQDVDKLALRATVNEAAALAGKGTVTLRRTAKVIRSRTAKLNGQAGRPAKLRITFSRKALRTIKAAIAAGRKPKVKITVTATDAAGNRSAKSKTVRLKN